jgi:hypothetical protein
MSELIFIQVEYTLGGFEGLTGCQNNVSFGATVPTGIE